MLLRVLTLTGVPSPLAVEQDMPYPHGYCFDFGCKAILGWALLIGLAACGEDPTPAPLPAIPRAATMPASHPATRKTTPAYTYLTLPQEHMRAVVALLKRAETETEAMTDPDLKDQSYRAIIGQYALAGEVAATRRLAVKVKPHDGQFLFFSYQNPQAFVISAMIMAGQVEQAKECVAQLSYPNDRGVATINNEFIRMDLYFQLVVAQVRARDLTGAKATAAMMVEGSERTEAYDIIAQAQSRVGGVAGSELIIPLEICPRCSAVHTYTETTEARPPVATAMMNTQEHAVAATSTADTIAQAEALIRKYHPVQKIYSGIHQ